MFFLQAHKGPDFIELDSELIQERYIDDKKKAEILKRSIPKIVTHDFSLDISGNMNISQAKEECFINLETQISYSFLKLGVGFAPISFQENDLKYYIYPKKSFFRTDINHQNIILAFFYSISQLNSQLPNFLVVDPFLEYNSAKIKKQYSSEYNDYLMGKGNDFFQCSFIYQILFKELFFSRLGLGCSSNKKNNISKKDNIYLDLLVAYELQNFPFFNDLALLFRLESLKKEDGPFGNIVFGFLHKKFSIYISMGTEECFPSLKLLFILSDIIKNFFKNPIERFLKFLKLAIGIDFDSRRNGTRHLLFRILYFEFKKDLGSNSIMDFSINFFPSWNYKR